ncbi:MAG: DNA cytosine methyltransferase, partial [Rhizobiales bacterium]|nr:DNA cytosine methyltransferase [Hyphomicrobiales bacterium]
GYIDEQGELIRDADIRERARSLGIPPAWSEVRIAASPRAHIQACGNDAAGRVQYIYHPDWEARRVRHKQQQLGLLTSALPRIRRRVRDDLDAEAGSKQLALARGVALIDRTAMRVGRERYLDAHGTRGAGTLYSRDVIVDGDAVQVRFPAKSGKKASYGFTDARLAAAIDKVKAIPGRRLLMYRDEDGKPMVLRTDDLNRYLKQIAGVAVTAKDFRTLHASALAAEALARLEPADSVTARKRQMAEVTRQVAAFLRQYGCWDERELVTLVIRGVTYIVVDIGMRMLTPRELYSAQGFPRNYIIDRDAAGRVFSKEVQVSCVGNSVCPPVAKALVSANCNHLAADEIREAA